MPLTVAFFAGRIVSYSLYVGGASLARDSLGDTFADVFTSPVGIALQFAMLAALVVLVRVDWIALAGGRPYSDADRIRMRPDRRCGPTSSISVCARAGTRCSV